jgi:hypothetical protein
MRICAFCATEWTSRYTLCPVCKRNTRHVYKPSLEQIQLEAEIIQREWTEVVRRKRMGYPDRIFVTSVHMPSTGMVVRKGVEGD